MAQTHNKPSWLAYFKESTWGVSPPDGAAWVAGGAQVEHISLDLSGVAQAFVPDPTFERKALSVGGRYNVPGIRNCGFKAGIKLHGTGVVTDPGDQVAATYLCDILEHCMGGVHRGTSHTVEGGSTTVVELDAVTGIVKGCLIGFEDTTSPSSANLGKLHVRRVIDIDDGDPFTVTLSEALPFTPAAGDLAHGGITAYPKESVLTDSVVPAVKTWSWLVKKTRAGMGADLVWQIEGSVASFEVQGLDRGALPSLSLDVMAGNFRHGAADGLENPAFVATPAGNAQLSQGRDFLYNFGTYGNTAIASQDCNKCSFTVGYKRTPVETNTEKTNRMEGLASWSFTPAPSKIAATFVPYTAGYYNELAAQTTKRVTMYQPGDGTGPGKCWAIHCPKMQIAATPKREDVGDVNGLSIELMTMEPDDVIDGGDDEDLEQATFLIFIG
jgi:hypothetical protein